MFHNTAEVDSKSINPPAKCYNFSIKMLNQLCWRTTSGYANHTVVEGVMPESQLTIA
jgi:hypothetical protein